MIIVGGVTSCGGEGRGTHLPTVPLSGLGYDLLVLVGGYQCRRVPPLPVPPGRGWETEATWGLTIRTVVVVVSLQSHSPANAIIREDWFVLREVVEESFDLWIVVSLESV